MNKHIYENEIINSWIKDNEIEELTNKRFTELSKIINPMYDFILAYSNYWSIRRDYGTGDKLTMIEAHILTDIFDYNGITVTQLAEKWRKTSSAISQIVKKLIQRKFVNRTINENDAKIYHLTVTKSGEKVVMAHKHYDNIDIIKTRKTLLKEFTIEELVTFDRICEAYKNILIHRKEKESL